VIIGEEIPPLLMAWLGDVAAGIELEADADRRLRDLLARWIGRSVSGIDPAELSDIADEALLRAYVALEQGRLDITRVDAPGYVLTTARRVAYDHLRRQHPTPVDPGDLSRLSPPHHRYDDEAIAAMIDRTSDLSAVRAAMRRVVESRQLSTVRVVATWLDLACQTGEPPSLRDVAAKVGLSHTAVRRHWTRFRKCLLDAQQESGS
jgi:DNA-directed RNA polymerase specialized sigma24 family protein